MRRELITDLERIRLDVRFARGLISVPATAVSELAAVEQRLRAVIDRITPQPAAAATDTDPAAVHAPTECASTSEQHANGRGRNGRRRPLRGR